MNKYLIPTASILLASCASVGDSPTAYELEPRAPAVQEHHAEEPGHGGRHAAGTQTVNVFAGASDELGDKAGFTLGLDYEYRLGPRWGVGGFLEGINGADRSLATGVAAFWHPVGDLVLVAGPGVERRHHEWGGILRVGGFYEFPLKNGLILSPALYYDFTEHDDIVVYGLNLGYSW